MDIPSILTKAYENSGQFFNMGKLQRWLLSWHKGTAERIVDAMAYVIQSQEVVDALPGIEASIAKLDAWIEERKPEATRARAALAKRRGQIDTVWNAPRDPRKPEKREPEVAKLERALQEASEEMGPVVLEYGTRVQVRSNLVMIAEALRKVQADTALLADLGIGGDDDG